MRRQEATQSRDRDVRRETLLAIATRVFGKRGFEAPVMAELADACGCERRTLYRYFPGKEDFFWSAVLRSYRALVERFSVISAVWNAGRVDAVGRIRSWALAYLEFSLERPEDFSLVMEARKRAVSSGIHTVEKEAGAIARDLRALDRAVLGGLAGTSALLESQGACAAGTGERRLWELLGVLIALVEFHARYRGGGAGFPFGTPEGVRGIIHSQIDAAFAPRKED
jgi:AcrR family transcriptional regulator